MNSRDVLHLWFGAGEDPWDVAPELMKRWFVRDPAFDAEIEASFGDAIAAARRGELDGWADSARGRLALLILLDQFPRNVFRGHAGAFASDGKALEIALEGLSLGHDASVRPVERTFFYLPLEHAEDLGLQDRSVALFTALEAEWPGVGFAKMAREYAEKHREIIARFGRYPHRNAVLGRESTPEELEYLSQPGAGF